MNDFLSVEFCIFITLQQIVVLFLAMTAVANGSPVAKSKHVLSENLVEYDPHTIKVVQAAPSSAQSKSFDAGRGNGGFNQRQFNGGNTYTRPIPSNNYGSPQAAPQGPRGDVKVLPLPIPIALPVPVPHSPGYGYGYGHGGGYGYSYSGGLHSLAGASPLSHGIFGGFGGPLSELLKDGKSNKVFGGLGFDPIKASIVAGRSNPFIHLLSAPYIKNIKENTGEDLPSLEDLQELLERSSFGLTGLDDFRGNN